METTLKLLKNDFDVPSRRKRHFDPACKRWEIHNEGFTIFKSGCSSSSDRIFSPNISTWKRSKFYYGFEQIFEREQEGRINIELGDVTLIVRSTYLTKLHLSLDTHKGNLMNQESKNRYLRIMSAFAHLGIKGCFASYSIINKFVKTRLHIDDKIVLNTTFFENRESDVIAFSIEYDGEIVLVGSDNAMEIADSFKKLLESL